MDDRIENQTAKDAENAKENEKDEASRRNLRINK